MVVSSVINTEKILFDSDYHLVDWLGHVGSDLFKAMTVFVISGTIVTIAAFWGITVPIIAGYLLLVGVDVFISSEWKQFELEDKIVTELKGVISE